MTERVVAEVRCSGKARHLLAEAVDTDTSRVYRVWKVMPQAVLDGGAGWAKGDDRVRVATEHAEIDLPRLMFSSCRCGKHTSHTIDVARLIERLACSTHRTLRLGISQVMP